jgi:addiction module RelE/StbE family toxin
MKINLHPQFKKSYKSRIATNKKLVKQTEARITIFKDSPKNPLLKDHGLTGAKKELRAFSVAGDIRIVYLPVSAHEVTFLDIGSHNQVY